MNKYFIPGNTYYFILSLRCTNDSIYECFVNSVPHYVKYEYSKIVCQIEGGNKDLFDISAYLINQFSINLDGNSFTYDPDSFNIINSKNNLMYYWNCTKTITTANNISQQIVSFAYEYFNENKTYSYEFGMIVSDIINIERETCYATVIK